MRQVFEMLTPTARVSGVLVWLCNHRIEDLHLAIVFALNPLLVLLVPLYEKLLVVLMPLYEMAH
jgi:hypothetical protein